MNYKFFKLILITFLLVSVSQISFAQKAQKAQKNNKPGKGERIVHGTKHREKQAPSRITGGTTATGEQIVYAQRSAMGYRIMVLTTEDRHQALTARSKLLSLFPDQKPYIVYTAPTIKLKFGNFINKAEADRVKGLIRNSGIVKTPMYLIPEPVEIKPPKPSELSTAATPTLQTQSPLIKSLKVDDQKDKNSSKTNTKNGTTLKNSKVVSAKNNKTTNTENTEKAKPASIVIKPKETEKQANVAKPKPSENTKPKPNN